MIFFFFFQAEDGIRDLTVTGVQTCALPISDYRVPDRVKVAHILFKTTGKNPAEVSTIEKTAQDVLAQVKSGADFAALAKQHSEDTSAQSGGGKGWGGRQQR